MRVLNIHLKNPKKYALKKTTLKYNFLTLSDGRGHCGADAQGYMIGAHPTNSGESVVRTVCFYLDNNSCWRTTDVEIKMCNGYYLYKLKDVPGCSARYCGQ